MAVFDEARLMAAVSWTVNSGGAALECGGLRGSVELNEIGASFQVTRWQARSIYGLNVLSYFGPSSVNEQLGVAETYVRGGDFVATFDGDGKQHVTPQLYWRAECFDELKAVKLELIVSVKTDLLDSRPLSRTHSLFSTEAALWHAAALKNPGFEALRPPGQPTGSRVVRVDGASSNEHLFVVRMPALGLSYAQLVHPTDFVAAELGIDSEPPYSLLATLFPERLEKGVIRRGRVCGFFMPIENDLDVAGELARRFADEPLPLTT